MKFLYLLCCAIIGFLSCSRTTTEIVEVAKEPMVNTEDFRFAAPAPAPAGKIQIGRAESFVLKNGLQVVVVENHKIPTVSYQITLKNEPIIEGDEKGFVDFAGQLLSRGTSTKSKAEIDEAVDFIGAELNTSSTGLTASSLTKHSDVLLDVVTDILYNATLPTEELEKIRKQGLSGIEATKTDGNAMVTNVAARVNFGLNHPYGEVQTAESTNKVSLKRCKDYYNKFFIPNNAYLIIVGDITLDDAKIQVNKYFGKWSKKPFKPVVNLKPGQTKGRQVAFAHKEGAVQSVIRMTHIIDLKPGDPDYINASLMNSILGGSFSGRLFKNLREDKAYTYGAYSSLRSDRLTGTFATRASVRNEVTDSSVIEFIYELERIRDKQVEEEELQSAKNFITGSFARSMESPETIARFALNIIRYNLPEDYYQTYLERLNAATLDDVQKMAQKYVRPDNINIVISGNKDEVSKSLISLDSDGKIDYYDSFGDEVKYDVVMPEGATGNMVITDYLTAIGGIEKLKSIKTMKTVMSSEMMGQSITIEISQKAPDKYAMSVGNGTMIFQEQKFNGEKAMAGGMGQNQVFTEGDQFEAMKSQAVMIPQLNYLEAESKLDLLGIEAINDDQCYKLTVTAPSGKKTTEYYNLANGLLVRSITTQEAAGQAMTITNDYMDYQESGGILFPMKLSVSGAMPVPMEMKVEELIIDNVIDDAVFDIK